MMASAAFFVGSQANFIAATGDAQIGSVGIVLRVIDTSEMMKSMGMIETVIRTGPLKAVGVGKVTQIMKDDLEEMVAKRFKAFVDTVERTRGKLSKAVLTGKMFWADDAKQENLIDHVGSIDEML